MTGIVGALGSAGLIPSRRRSGWSRYTVAGSAPTVVADMRRNRYRAATGIKASLTDWATFARAGNATMVDSSGNLKWAAHNIALNSVFSGGSAPSTPPTGWSSGGVPVIVSIGTRGLAGAASYRLTASASRSFFARPGASVAVEAGASYTAKTLCEVFMAGCSISEMINLAGVTPTSTQYFIDGVSAISTDIVPVGIHVIEKRHLSISAGGTIAQPRVGLGVNSNVTGEIEIWDTHLYRSDLGGMANNPDTGDSYVPTTTAAVYKERLGHHTWNGSAWVNKGLLLESEARTNLCLWSQDLTNAAHNKFNLTAGAPVVAGPDGLISLNRITLSASNAEHSIFPVTPLVVTTNAVHAISRFFKAGTQRYVGVRASRSVNNWSTVVADLQTGTITQQSNGAGSGTILLAGVINWGNGLYQVYLVSSQAGTSLAPCVQAHSSGTPTLDTNGAEVYLSASQTFDCGFAQDEAGSVPSSYIPTTTAAATRAAETLLVPAANMAYSATAMSFAMQGEMNYADNNSGLEVSWMDWQADTNNLIRIYMQTVSGTGQPAYRQRFAATDSFSPGGASDYAPGLGVPFGVASRALPLSARGAFQGVLGSVASPTGMPNLAAIPLSMPHVFMGTIALFRQWDADIGDAGITAASLPLAA